MISNINQKYFPALDGLRAVCICLVIYVHVPKGSVLAHLQGRVGVDIFFVISGFLITALLLREENANQKIDLRAFYVRRFFRIIPLYSVILLFYVVQASTNSMRWQQMRQVLPYYLTFMNDLVAVRAGREGGFTGVNRAPFGATWSLGIEEKFYLLWPVLFFFVFKQRWRFLALPLLFVIASLLPPLMFRSYFGLLVGCGLAISLLGSSGRVLIGILVRIPSFVVFLLMLSGFYLIDRGESFIFVFDIIAALLVAILIVGDNWLVRIMSSAPLVWVGRRSYSMYLIQAVVLSVVERVIKPLGAIRQLTIIILSIVLASIGADALYRLVEEPSRRYGKKILATSGREVSS